MSRLLSFERRWLTPWGGAFSSDMLLSSLSRLSSARTMYPECLPMDDTILHLAFDDADPARLRVGTSNGTIACVSF